MCLVLECRIFLSTSDVFQAVCLFYHKVPSTHQANREDHVVCWVSYCSIWIIISVFFARILVHAHFLFMATFLTLDICCKLKHTPLSTLLLVCIYVHTASSYHMSICVTDPGCSFISSCFLCVYTATDVHISMDWIIFLQQPVQVLHSLMSLCDKL